MTQNQPNPLNIDFNYYFNEAYKIEYEKYSKTVENNLYSLIQSEISDHKFSDIVVIGRKGINLFQPYIKQINGKNNLQGIYSIQLASFTEGHLFKILHSIRFSKFKLIQMVETLRKKYFGTTVLLTDAINEGHEISNVIENINHKRISKICGYVANKRGVSELQKKYPKIQFSFTKIVDDNEYAIEQDKLQNIYQSRLVPIDGDHPYRIYSLKYQIGTDDLVNYMERSISKYKESGFDLKKDDLIVPHILSYTSNLDFDLIAEANPELKQSFYNVERTQMRFKIDPKLSKLRIMAIALDILDPKLNENSVIQYSKCGLNIPKKLCETTIMFPLP